MSRPEGVLECVVVCPRCKSPGMEVRWIWRGRIGYFVGTAHLFGDMRNGEPSWADQMCFGAYSSALSESERAALGLPPLHARALASLLAEDESLSIGVSSSVARPSSPSETS